MFDWPNFIQNLPNNGKIKHNTHADPSSVSLCLLSQYQLISISGADALTFIQGQCSCDFQKLDNELFSYGSHCTPKGRMISSFLATKIKDGTYYLRVHHTTLHALISSLKKYSVFSKVHIDILSHIACMALMGDEHKIHDVVSTLNISALKKITHSHDPTNTIGRTEIWLDTQSIDPNTPLFSQPMIPINAWDVELIKNGIGEVREESIEQLLPQEINLQLIAGVDFKKGCYTGQEIIARMHYRANLKKHMYYGKICDTTELPEPQCALLDRENQKKIGSIIFSATTHSCDVIFLALVNDEYTQNDKAIISPLNDAKIQWQPLPYAIT